MAKKLPKGRARRGQSVRKVINAFKTRPCIKGVPKRSLRELQEETGLSQKALLDTLKELIEREDIDREVSDDSPPQVYYRFIAFIPDEQIEELEKEYEQRYESLISILGVRLRLEHEGKHQGFESLKKLYHASFPITRSMDASEIYRRDTIKKIYFKHLNDCINHLKHAIQKELENSQPKKWEKCRNCKYGKRMSREQIEDQVTVQCTLRWRQRGGREEHPSDDFCDNFEMKLPS